MALLDFILDRTGAIGARIRGVRMRAARDEVLMKRPRSPVRSVLTTADGKKLIFDVARDISHNFPSKVTSYPVEDKSTVSDHVVNENPKFSITGVFSDANVKLLSVPNSFTQTEVYRMLLKMRDDRKVVTLLTPIDSYTDLILTSFSTSRSANESAALVVQLDFEKIRRVSNEFTTVFVGSTTSTEKKKTGETSIKNKEEKDGGNKEAKPEDNRSRADKAKDALLKLGSKIVDLGGL